MTTELQITPKQKVLNEVSNNLSTLLEQNQKAFPKDFNKTRFLQNCITVLNDTKDIEKCTPLSVTRTMIKGAYLGLDFFRRECYAIPYEKYENSRPTGICELNFQTDYKGEKKLCMQYSERPILDIYAKVVKEGDDFDVEVEEGKQSLRFRPLPFNDNKPIGVFAVVYFKDGGMAFDTMSIKELEKTKLNYVKKSSGGEYGPSWKKSEEEMWKKMVMRRICKVLSLNFDNSDQDKAFEEGAVTLVKVSEKVIDTKITDPFEKKDDGKDIVPVDPHAALRAKIMKEHPEYESWQVDAIINEHKEANAK